MSDVSSRIPHLFHTDLKISYFPLPSPKKQHPPKNVHHHQTSKPIPHSQNLGWLPDDVAPCCSFLDLQWPSGRSTARRRIFSDGFCSIKSCIFLGWNDDDMGVYIYIYMPRTQLTSFLGDYHSVFMGQIFHNIDI